MTIKDSNVLAWDVAISTSQDNSTYLQGLGDIVQIMADTCCTALTSAQPTALTQHFCLQTLTAQALLANGKIQCSISLVISLQLLVHFLQQRWRHIGTEWSTISDCLTPSTCFHQILTVANIQISLFLSMSHTRICSFMSAISSSLGSICFFSSLIKNKLELFKFLIFLLQIINALLLLRNSAVTFFDLLHTFKSSMSLALCKMNRQQTWAIMSYAVQDIADSRAHYLFERMYVFLVCCNCGIEGVLRFMQAPDLGLLLINALF
jgi:hypothetical protein